MSKEEMYVEKLKDDVARQKQAVASLGSRINSMRDEVEALKTDMQKLRENVVADIKYLYDKV